MTFAFQQTTLSTPLPQLGAVEIFTQWLQSPTAKTDNYLGSFLPSNNQKLDALSDIGTWAVDGFFFGFFFRLKQKYTK